MPATTVVRCTWLNVNGYRGRAGSGAARSMMSALVIVTRSSPIDPDPVRRCPKPSQSSGIVTPFRPDSMSTVRWTSPSVTGRSR
jgi:hypothetical protein